MQITKKQTISLVVIFLVTAGIVAYLVLGAGVFTAGVDDSEVAATVNGDIITLTELENYSNQVMSSMPPGQELDDLQLLDDLINEKLINQDAERRGLSISEDDVDAEYSSVAMRFETEEDFQAALLEEGLTSEELRSMLSRNLIIDRYTNMLTEDGNFSATDEEIQNLYEEISAFQEDLPPLEEIRGQIEAQIINDKMAQAFDEALQELREDAEIEIFI